MKRVIIVRHWQGGEVFWDGQAWTSVRASAHVYESALTCPRHLPMFNDPSDKRKIHRVVHRYWAGGRLVWATVEDA